MATLLLFNLTFAGGGAVAVAFLLRGRTRLSPAAWGAIAVILFFALGNLINQSVLPGLLGDPLTELRAGRRPALSYNQMALLSSAIAFALVLAAGGLARLVSVTPAEQAAGAPPRDPALEHPQRVGQPCSACGQKILMDPQATACERCGAILHVGCAPQHRCG